MGEHVMHEREDRDREDDQPFLFSPDGFNAIPPGSIGRDISSHTSHFPPTKSPYSTFPRANSASRNHTMFSSHSHMDRLEPNGIALGLGGMSREDTFARKGMSEMEKAIFGEAGTGSEPHKQWEHGEGNSHKPITAAERLRREIANDDEEDDHETQGGAEEQDRSGTGRRRTRSRSKRRGGRSRSGQRVPGTAESRNTSRTRNGEGEENISRTGSGRGGKRVERRGERNERRDRDEKEEISTIFMVGFPDDISEREFSNIFTFAHGFEAASLKFPNAPSVFNLKDNTSTTSPSPHLNAQYSNSRLDMDEEDDMVNDAVRHLPASTAAALGLGQNSTANSSTTSLIGMGVNLRGPPRRQVIGFARFRTKADALVARDTLQGRKVDVFSGATLKVEMAKKNLHSRRGFGTGTMSLAGVPESEIMDVLMRSGKLPGLLAGLGGINRDRSDSGHRRETTDGSSNRDDKFSNKSGIMTGPSTPNGRSLSLLESRAGVNYHHSNSIMLAGMGQPMPSLGQATEEGSHPDYNTRASFSSQPAFSPRYVSMEMDQTPMNVKTNKHRRNDSLRSVFSADWSNPPVPLSQVPEHQYTSGRSDEHSVSHSHSQSQTQLGSSMNSATSGILLSSSNSSLDRHGMIPGDASPLNYSSPKAHKDSKALLALAEAEDGSEDWNIGGGGMDSLGAFDGESRNPSPSHDRGPMTDPASAYDPNLKYSINRGEEPFASRTMAGSTGRRSISGITGPRSNSDFGLANLNIADQNPPINTLYVGNLPSHLAVAQSPNYLEECLRNLFARANGFKRMSFRQKVNGPMCFVEFEGVDFATSAIKELYGNTLGGLVKGGLRLSYSKNSLGQRGNGQPTRVNTGNSLSDYTSPGSFSTSGPLSPTSSNGALNFIPFSSGRQNSGDSAQASSFKSDTPLSPHAAPFNSSSLPQEMASPRLRRFPSGGSERQTKDGIMIPISPRAGFSAPWPMTSISQPTPNHYASAQNGASPRS